MRFKKSHTGKASKSLIQAQKVDEICYKNPGKKLRTLTNEHDH